MYRKLRHSNTMLPALLTVTSRRLFWVKASFKKWKDCPREAIRELRKQGQSEENSKLNKPPPKKLLKAFYKEQQCLSYAVL